MARKPTPDELRKLKDKAAEAAGKGKLEKAAELYREAADGDPRDVATRQKLAEVLRRSGRIPDAIAAYRAVADRFGKDGLLIKAIAISKAILELDPQHVETQVALAELYARKAQVEGARPPPRTVMVSAVQSKAARPPPPVARPPEPEERAVAIALGPPSGPEAIEIDVDADAGAELPLDAGALPLELVVVKEAPLPPPTPRKPPEPRPQPVATAAPPSPASARPGPAGRPITLFARIMSAAEAAVQSGIEEDLRVRADIVDGELAGDEPLSFHTGEGGVELVDEPAAPEPGPVARIPIFSDLGREAFVALAGAMVLHRVSKGETVIREGDEGTSFYVVASGTFAVTKRDETGSPIPLARLGDGDFFGEMALLSGAARAASVTAEQDGEVLEFRADVLLELAGRHPHVARSLRRFYRQRLLANALAVSPIFRPFRRGDRKLIMERFRARDVGEGEVLVREGEPSDGLYVILEGAVDVLKRRDGQDLAIGHLREGDLFGEMSCLRKAPASASVVVRRPGTLLRLPRQEFDELVVTYPQILELVSTLSEERAESLDAILSGCAEWTDDGLVLV